MNFSYIEFSPFILVLFIFIYYMKRQEKLFFKWIYNHWFFSIPFKVKLGSWCKVFGLLFLFLILLDPRGDAKRVEVNASDQKTIILIDSSSSMLAEDIRPNRFQKALLLARHFVKNSYGHQVSVMVFSDTHKRLLPFTDDIDLLDSRISALEQMDLNRGGSNLSAAIFGAFAYFRESSSTESPMEGNLLVITDSEENGDSFEIKGDYSNINVAIIGVGTSAGSVIPIRLKNGRFQGNKKYQGQEIMTKLDESKLQSFSSIFPNYKYWVASSYALPTVDVLDFFRSKIIASAKKRSHISKPLKIKNFAILGLLLLLISYLTRMGSIFIKLCFILSFFIFSLELTSLANFAQAQVSTSNPGEESLPSTPQKTPREKFLDENSKELHLLQKGELSAYQKNKLAKKALGDKAFLEALNIYESSQLQDINSKVNYTTALLGSNRLDETINQIQKLQSEKLSKEHRETLAYNLKEALRKKQEQEKNQKQNQDQDQNQDRNQDRNQDQNQSKSNSSNDSQQNEQNKNQQENQKNQENQENKDNQNKRDQKQGDKQNDKNQNSKENREKSQREHEKDIEQKKKMIKVPGILKQLMESDRELQKRNIDPRTRESNKDPRKKRDW